MRLFPDLNGGYLIVTNSNIESGQVAVNELDVRDEGTELNVFVETTRWFGLKINLSGNNLLDLEQLRHRTIYVGERDMQTIDRSELTDRTDGRRIVLTVSGSF